MGSIFLATLLFGLIHPLSKVLLDTGIPLSYFCVLFIGIRLMVQVPTLLWSESSVGKINRTSLYPLLILGLCGAGLQLFEFKGISQGLNPAVVTLLMFTYPLWIVIGQTLFAGRSLELSSFLKASASLLGVSSIAQSSLTELGSLSVLIYPVLASLFIAGWIGLASHLRKKGVPALVLSTLYDMYSLVILLTLISPWLYRDWLTFLEWAQSPLHVLGMASYSLFLGLLPNLLFYQGSKNISAIAAGLIMAFEPIFSTAYTSLIWGQTLTPLFFLGCTLVVLANLPDEVFKLKPKIKLKPKT